MKYKSALFQEAEARLGPMDKAILGWRAGEEVAGREPTFRSLGAWLGVDERTATDWCEYVGLAVPGGERTWAK